MVKRKKQTSKMETRDFTLYQSTPCLPEGLGKSFSAPDRTGNLKFSSVNPGVFVSRHTGWTVMIPQPLCTVIWRSYNTRANLPRPKITAHGRRRNLTPRLA
ncbi:hypothetical protein RRG08_012776 [Elysia crispata]|uniref:Uncharacterized protein n=1 Tax=Elysia crispata TaxID=231223 RepID=A0AAE0YRQ3_9GAST|nr:hypothetical protein RRG08_012776 [Elysia crispata]